MRTALSPFPFRTILHGSFRAHMDEIMRVRRLFVEAGIEVLAPCDADVSRVDDGFVLFAGEEGKDRRLIELEYLSHLKRLGRYGFSYFVNPDGYFGSSASYELGVAQLSNVPCFFMSEPQDHPVYVHHNSVWKPERLVEYIRTYDSLPAPQISVNERHIHALWESLMVPGSVVAVGGIIEYASDDVEKDILLVRTHKWGDRFSVVGGRVRRRERLDDALRREIMEETGLRCAIGAHVCTFDQLSQSGYHDVGVQHIFVDKVVSVRDRAVVLNDEAEDYVWVKPTRALAELDIEPNARHTVELYAQMRGFI